MPARFVEDTVADSTLSDVSHAATAWGDYDGDGDLDLLLAGYSSEDGYVSKVYRNDGGTAFADIGVNAPLTGVSDAAVAWGDYDSDGDLDILLAGADSGSSFVTKIYANNGGTFVEDTVADDDLTDVYDGSLAWGDYDLDGDLDILLTGNNGIGPVSQVWKNDGDGTFSNSGPGSARRRRRGRLGRLRRRRRSRHPARRVHGKP